MVVILDLILLILYFFEFFQFFFFFLHHSSNLFRSAKNNRKKKIKKKLFYTQKKNIIKKKKKLKLQHLQIQHLQTISITDISNISFQTKIYFLSNNKNFTTHKIADIKSNQHERMPKIYLLFEDGRQFRSIFTKLAYSPHKSDGRGNLQGKHRNSGIFFSLFEFRSN